MRSIGQGSTTINAGDLEIGAVEIQDDNTSIRVQVNANQELTTRDGDAITQLTASAASLVSIDAGTPAGLGQAAMAASQPVVIASNQTGVPTTATAAGDVAHDGVDSGNPIKVGGQARTTPATAVSSADRSNFISTVYGEQIARGCLPEMLVIQNTTITTSTAETTIGTADATYKLYLVALVVDNKSATYSDWIVKDSTAGTTRLSGGTPATDMRGIVFGVNGMLPQATVNNNWTLTGAVSVTSLRISALFEKRLT